MKKLGSAIVLWPRLGRLGRLAWAIEVMAVPDGLRPSWLCKT